MTNEQDNISLTETLFEDIEQSAIAEELSLSHWIFKDLINKGQLKGFSKEDYRLIRFANQCYCLTGFRYFYGDKCISDISPEGKETLLKSCREYYKNYEQPNKKHN